MHSFRDLIETIDAITETEMAESWVALKNKSTQKLYQDSDAANKISALRFAIEQFPPEELPEAIGHAPQLMAKINYLFILLVELAPDALTFKNACQTIIDFVFQNALKAERDFEMTFKQPPFVTEEAARQFQAEPRFVDLDEHAKHLALQKYSLVQSINSIKTQLEKIEILRIAGANHKAHLLTQIRKQRAYRDKTDEELLAMAADISTKDANSIAIKELDLAQLNITHHLLTILNKPGASNFKVMEFDAYFRIYDPVFNRRKDTETEFWLKVVASVLSIGLLVPLLWEKTKGQGLSKNIRLTLFGNHLKTPEVVLNQDDDLKPSVMDKNIPTVTQHKR